MINYFSQEWIKFEKRFWLTSLLLLLKWIVDAERISPYEYVEKISDKIHLIILSIEDDNLFEHLPMKNYFRKVKRIREEKNNNWKTIFNTIKSDNETKKSWHDGFLWENIIQKISDKVIKSMDKIKN